MNGKMGFGVEASSYMIRNRNPNIGLAVGGYFTFECFDKNGNLKWAKKAKNGVVNSALNDVLDTYFRGGTPADGFALGLISGPGPTLDATDTHDSHSGWSEFTGYDIGGNSNIRPEWSPDPASSQQLANSTLIDYSMTATGTVSGAFLVGGTITTPTPGATDANNKGSTDSTPLLFAHALLSGGDQSVNNGDTLRVTYRVNAASA